MDVYVEVIRLPLVLRHNSRNSHFVLYPRYALLLSIYPRLLILK
jgi:hypothetical protein